MTAGNHDLSLEALLEDLPLAMSQAGCSLPESEIKQLPEQYARARAGLTYLSRLDRAGAKLALMWHSQWYLLHLNSLNGRCHLFIKTPAGPRWAGQEQFDRRRQNYNESVLQLQAPGYGSRLLLSWLPIVLFYVVLLINFKVGVTTGLATMILWAGYRLFYTLAPQAVRDRLDVGLPGRIATAPSALTVKCAIKNLRPFLLMGMFFSGFTMPFMLFFHWLGRITGFNAYIARRRPIAADTLLLPQNLPTPRGHAVAFFDSPAFAITIMTIVLSGIPAYLTYVLYIATGANTFFGNPLAHMLWWQFFLKYFYLGSVACAMAVLFVKAWFTFPLNFISTQYNIEISPQKIIKDNVQGWFAEVMFYGFDSVYHNSELPWSKVIKVDCEEGVSYRYHPLPTVVFKADSSVYKLLNACAALMDALTVSKVQDRTLTLTGNDASRLRVRVFELDARQRIDLLTAIRKYAPQAVITDRAQEALVGRAVLKESSHTELWFSILSGEGSDQTANQTALSAEPEPGTLLKDGKYSIVSRLAGGGQATIYDARVVATGERIILKEFVLADGDGVEALLDSAREFENESLILSRLDHPQIVKMVDMFVERKRAYLAIEYVNGKSLRQLVGDQGAQDESTVVALAEQMCDILHYLASLDTPVVHRDFTPDNLLVDAEGKLKLIDFSISQLYLDASQGECAGKHSYTPPEQYRGQATPQSDIYAYGATLHFLLTGEDPVAISQSHPRAVNGCISEAMDAYVAHATAITLAERYVDANWARMDLKTIPARS